MPFIFAKKIIRPLLKCVLLVQRKVVGFQTEVIHRERLNSNKPVIFAVTHIGKWDIEIVNEQIPSHFHIVMSDFLNTYGKISGIFVTCTGVIWVNEHSTEDKHNTKEIMKKVLAQNDSVMIFPEGAWNLYEAEIIKDIAYGAADVAIQTKVDIIPIAVEQYDKRFVINVGLPLRFQNYYENKEILTSVLRDTMATLKWEIWEREGVQSREIIPELYWDDFIVQRMKEWEGCSMTEQMLTFISRERLEYWSVQRDLRTGYLPRWYRIYLREEGEK